MSILINKNSKVIVQGFTGKKATFHSKEMIKYGTNIVGGVTPNKGGKIHLNKPVFDSVLEAVKYTNANTSIIFVPSNFSTDSIIEAIESKIKLIVCITDGITILDMIKIKNYLKNFNCNFIGPNCPGIISPNISNIGIMPNNIFKKGNIGIVSRSGTLTYEVVDIIVKLGLGISTAVGIGGDPVIGLNIKDIVSLFIKDKSTDLIFIIGEIGGDLELKAAKWIYNNKKNLKPVISFIAGKTAPKGHIMGHAGAIISNKKDKAKYKIESMKKLGIEVVDSILDIGKTIKRIL